MMVYEGKENMLHIVLILVLDGGGEVSFMVQPHYPWEKSLQYHYVGRLGGPQN
jgi:hypothetical protein